VGRHYRGLDIDPAYVDVAMTRWSEITGMEPKLIYRTGEKVAA
jgi:DNA modification methylase